MKYEIEIKLKAIKDCRKIEKNDVDFIFKKLKCLNMI